MQLRYQVLLAVAGATVLAATTPLAAQQRTPQREVRGFDFTPDGVWRGRARRIADNRMRLLARGDITTVNAAARAPSTRASNSAITGVLRSPVFLVRYKNSPAAGSLFSPASYQDALFATSPPAGRPYTVRTYYEEVSLGQFSMQGTVTAWVDLDSNDTYYEGPDQGTTPCNGLSNACSRVATLIIEAVQRSDASVDYGQFDNDGPDGVPNSGDDDGEVDVAVLVHPEVGGECGGSGNRNIWAHRFSMNGRGTGPIATNDPWTGRPGNTIKINNYTIQSGVGGQTCSDAGTIMPPGTIAHELGHGLGLPDFYDTNPNDGDNSEGIGEWGLMGSGNYARPYSPAHMEAFSRVRLGWAVVRPLTTGGTYTFGPVEIGDTVFMIRPPAGVPNSRGEYFLLENRQRVLSDSALINRKGGTGGLAIWHIDSLQYESARSANTINSGAIHAVWMRQADGVNALRSSTPGIRNRGDAGDLWPGSSNNTAFVLNANPEPRLNGGTQPFASFMVDSIRQVVPNGEMAFRLRIGALTVVRASDTTASIRVRGVAFNVYRDLLVNGDTFTVSVDSVQFVNSNRTEFTFTSWSDAGARTHVYTGGSAGATLTANMATRHKATVITAGSGTVVASPALNVAAGAFIAAGDSVTLTATPGAGNGFAGWTGDTTSTNPVLKLRMNRPFTVTATFQTALAVSDTALRAPLMGAPFADTVKVSGGTGTYTYALVAGSLPPGLGLAAASGIISGIAANDSTYTFTVRATSGGQTLDLPLRLSVTAPTLALSAVVDQFLGTGTLTVDERRYLDLNGNNNAQLDVGDFAAWLDKTGLVVSADVMSRVMRRQP